MRLQGRNLSIEMRGEDVKLLHSELHQLGYDIKDTEVQESSFGLTTQKAVTTFQKRNQLETTGVVDEETARAINAAVDAAIFRVEGQVASRARAGVAGLRVEIVDKNVGEDVRLAGTATDDEGIYQAMFSITQLYQRGKKRPDLQARVFSRETFLGASDVRYNASNHETLNILLMEKADDALPSEYETLTSSLFANFRGNLRDLKETDDRQDITYLANKTGWDARAVALAALADQFSSKTAGADGVPKIEPSFFYALFRAGIPANENSLYQADAKTVSAVWEQGIKQGVIPATLNSNIPKALEHFQSLAAKRALDGPPLAGVSTLKEMLSISLGDDRAKQERFADLYTRYRDDLPKFWEAVRGTFGEAAEKRLKVDGQLSYLTLNNALLIRKLHDTGGPNGLSDTVSLATSGYYRAKKWLELIGAGGVIPPEIQGKDDKEKRLRYAELLAAQVRLSFPTAVVAQMVKNKETMLYDEKGKEIPAEIVNGINVFLAKHQVKFEIGMQPVEQYLARNNLQISPEVRQGVKRIQRVYQITPSDEAMNILLKNRLDSAYAVVRYDRDEFVRTFKDELGEENAMLTYVKSLQVHNAVLNIATSYLIASTAPAIGMHSPAGILNPTPTGSQAPNAGDVIAYPTLEGLFGEMDYCACDHCRSILSPAAYLVDLLLFCDRPTNEKENPLTVLLERRPDIQHLPLTCENTNMPLPYIDLVNETLEYYVTNNLSLANYTGHTTDGDATPEELLASPMFVRDAAYTTLAGAHFPFPLPFHQPLENLRRYFDRFEAPLPKVMEALRKDDSLERPNANEYGWRDILMEELRLSRAEYALLTQRELTNGNTDVMLTLKQLYGYPAATTNATVLDELSNVKAFTRRVGISYEDIIEILKTSFVNPNSTLIPKLERLHVPFTTLKALKDGTITDAQFDALMPMGIDASQYGGDIKAWVKNNVNYTNIMSLITLANPTAPDDVCSFDKVEFRYADPAKINDPIRTFEFVRLIRFIRLWKKLGWTIEQTDKVITALYPTSQIPNDPNDAVNLQRLDTGFLTMLPRLGVVKRVMGVLKLKPKKDLLPLLACFAPIDTHGAVSLYRQMFLSSALLKLDDAFKDDGYGNFLDGSKKLLDHKEALRAAFQLTDDEFVQTTTALGYGANTALDVDNISAVFRRGWLARKLKLSVREFLLLTQFTDIDPFAAPDPAGPPILRFIELVDKLRAASLKPVQALYLIWNQDISGKSTPEDGEITSFARTLRSNFTTIENEFALADDPDGQIARARMALVYGSDATEQFFGLLDKKTVTDVPYSHSQATLEQAILDAAQERIAYDNLRKRLSYSAGVMPDAIRNALKGVAGVTQAFKDAVDELHKKTRVFFDRYPELLPLYEGYAFFGQLSSSVNYIHGQATLEQDILDAASNRISYNHTHNLLSFNGVMTIQIREALKNVAGVTVLFRNAIDGLFNKSQTAINDFFNDHQILVPQKEAYLAANDSEERRRSVFLATFLPELKLRRKRQQALQTISAAANADITFASALLDDAAVLHATGDNTRPALDDLLALEITGLSAQFYFRNTATGVVDLTSDAEADLAYAATGSNKLPANPVPANAISGIWSGYLEAPENGFYNIRIEADAGATVTLSLGGATVSLAQSGNVWTNNTPIELRAGMLYDISLTVEKVKDTLNVRWETTGRGWEIIPPQYLYSATLTDYLRTTYIRFLKSSSLATGLKLTANEIAHFAAHTDYKIGGHGWLNSLPVTGSPNNATSIALFIPFIALLDFARIKSSLSPDDERLLSVLQDPDATLPNGDNLLLTMTRWESDSLDALLVQFGKVSGGRADRGALKDLNTLCLVYEAYVWVKKMGIPASVLIKAATNEPIAITVRDLQAALRARYDENDWLNVLKPINDQMRGLQRDALVAYILHQMRLDPASEHIDTPDKLFEYFLMDVQMEPCMQTSRIRHALSSVQLFIERCLMNLETDVAPSSINAKQWEWMKRYRVWEANRKVFLFPENWLEPELRDNQSPFFKEAMSELLQSDITEDRAAVALLNYLSKLEEVAKLEPCGIHYVENDPGTADDIAHVVARTAGANRKYYYRRREYGYWTPWEQIKLDIEDNPVLPVVWKGRLFLFWLRILKAPIDLNDQTPISGPKVNNAEQSFSQMTMSDTTSAVKTAAQQNTKIKVQAVLCWSEYYNGKWQPTKTSDVNKPTKLDLFSPSGPWAFNRSRLLLSDAPEDDALWVFITGSVYSTFLLYNTHSLPVRQEDQQNPYVANAVPRRHFWRSGNIFRIGYFKKFDEDFPSLTRSVLANSIHDSTIAPLHALQIPWDAPFFYEDSHHVFYVTTTRKTITIPDWSGYTITLETDYKIKEMPPVIIKEEPRLWPEPRIIPKVPIGPGDPGVVDPLPIERFVSEDAYITRGIGTMGTVRFGEAEIGPAGKFEKFQER